MSKIKFSALVSDMRNKLNGSVLSKNRYGSYMRNKVTPVNPQTSFQTDQRANLSALSSIWRSLTQAQRDAWTALAQSSPRTDIFGDPKILAGNALFVSFNLNLLKAGEASLTDAPSLVAVPVVTGSGLTMELTASVLTTGEVTVSPATVPAGFSLIVYATPGVSPGVSFVKNKYRYLGIYAPTTGVVNFTADYISRFGNPSVGSKVFVRLALVSTDSGQLGLPSEVQTFVTTI